MKKLLTTVAALGMLTSTASAETVFKYAFQGDITGVDPHALYETFQISTMSNVYEGLVDRGPNLKLRPSLATSWKPISDTEWEVKLRKGVKFHNGNDFTAEDVKFSFERALNTDYKPVASKVKEVKIVDDHTIILVTPAKDPILMGYISGLLIMDKDWTVKNKSDKPDGKVGLQDLYSAKYTNGTGPFKIESTQAGVKTVFVRNKNYWNKNIATNIDRAILQPIKQPATRVAALLSGAVDMAYPIPLQDQDRLNKNDKVDVLAGPETRTIFVGFDQLRDELKYSNIKGKNPFKDIRVRQAFVHAVNTDLINKKIMRGSAVPTGTMVAEAVNGWNAEIAKPYKYDLAKSKKLLAEAGYPNGFSVTMDCPNNRYVNDEKICQAIVSMLGKIGVKVDLLAQPKAQYFAKVLPGGGYDTSFYLIGWSPGSLDALDPLDFLIRCREDGKGAYNLGGYCNRRITELADKIGVELDQKKRQAMFDEAYAILKKEYGYMPLHDQALSWGASKKIKLVQRANNVLKLADVVVNK